MLYAYHYLALQYYMLFLRYALKKSTRPFTKFYMLIFIGVLRFFWGVVTFFFPTSNKNIWTFRSMPKKNLQVSDLFAKLDVNKDGFVWIWGLGGHQKVEAFLPWS